MPCTIRSATLTCDASATSAGRGSVGIAGLVSLLSFATAPILSKSMRARSGPVVLARTNSVLHWICVEWLLSSIPMLSTDSGPHSVEKQSRIVAPRFPAWPPSGGDTDYWGWSPPHSDVD
jgi:hypothetical protein